MPAAGVTVGDTRLWRLYEDYRASTEFPPSARQMAAKIGMSTSGFTNWASTKTFALPRRPNLEAFAKVIGEPYLRVLEAALHDAKYIG